MVQGHGCCSLYSGGAFKGTKELQPCPDCSKSLPKLVHPRPLPPWCTSPDYTTAYLLLSYFSIHRTGRENSRSHMLKAYYVRVSVPGFTCFTSLILTASWKTGAKEMLLWQLVKQTQRSGDLSRCPQTYLPSTLFPSSEFTSFSRCLLKAVSCFALLQAQWISQ